MSSSSLSLPANTIDFGQETVLDGKDGKTLTVYVNWCMQTAPCQHHVRIDGKQETWSGKDIVQWCRDNAVDVPAHFNYLVNPRPRQQRMR